MTTAATIVLVCQAITIIVMMFTHSLKYKQGVRDGLRQAARKQILERALGVEKLVARNGKVITRSSTASLTHECGGLWSKWERKGVRVEDQVTGEYLGTVDYSNFQERSCDQCGFTDRKKVGT